MNHSLLTMCLLGMSAMLIGCGSGPTTSSEREALTSESRGGLKAMEAADPGLADFMRNAYAYAIFPTVGKGGLIVGGAHGRGTVFKNDTAIGWAEMNQATVGAQIGGQSYKELLG